MNTASLAEQMQILQQMMLEILSRLDALQLQVASQSNMQADGNQAAQPEADGNEAAQQMADGHDGAQQKEDGDQTAQQGADGNQGQADNPWADHSTWGAGWNAMVARTVALPPGAAGPSNAGHALALLPGAAGPSNAAPPGLSNAGGARPSVDEDDCDLNDPWWREFLAHDSVYSYRADGTYCNLCKKWSGWGHATSDKHKTNLARWEKNRPKLIALALRRHQ